MGKGKLDVAADEDGVVLPAHSVVGSVFRALLYCAAPMRGVLETPAEKNEGFPGVLARAPIIIILMRGNGFRQIVARAEEIDRSSFAIVAG